MSRPSFSAMSSSLGSSPNWTQFSGLVSQLQSMEMQLTTVLMEATMKIASMIDANVFVLVESASGNRFFSGKQYLRDSYLEGSFKVNDCMTLTVFSFWPNFSCRDGQCELMS